MTGIYQIRMLAVPAALAMMALISALVAACGSDDGSDTDGSPTILPSSSGTVSAEPTPVLCNDEAIRTIVDQWTSSVVLLVAEETALTFSDEEGFREDVELPTREYCALGDMPPPEASRAYCTDIVTAIDPRLDGPEEERQAFLTEYYDSCDAT